MNLRDMGEFGLIERFAKPLGRHMESLVRGIGDDCAVIRPPAGRHLLVTSDMMIEGTHFWPGRIAPRDLGHKALCASLSDIAAMGGRALYAFLSLGVPEETNVAWIEQFFDGMGRLAGTFGVALAGGDTVASPLVVADVTVLGQSESDRLALRSGAAVGDLIMVTGQLGGSAAGLCLTRGEIDPADLPAELREVGSYAASAHFRPWPRLREASALMQYVPPSSMMDISDGLAGDARHIASCSGVGMELWLGSLPVPPGLHDLALYLKDDADSWALFGGEDYELLLTMPEHRAEEARRCLRDSTGTALTVVGRVTSEADVVVVDRSGRPAKARKAFEHFQAVATATVRRNGKGSKP